LIVPYEPNTSTVKQRSYAYIVIWVGFACALAVLGMAIWFPDVDPPGVAIGWAAGGMLISTLIGRSDEYFSGLCTVGHRMACAFLAICLFAVGVMRILDGETSGIFGFFSAMTDNFIIVLGTTLAFYTGYALAWLRDRF
jgi:hypothetical protein